MIVCLSGSHLIVTICFQTLMSWLTDWTDCRNFKFTSIQTCQARCTLVLHSMHRRHFHPATTNSNTYDVSLVVFVFLSRQHNLFRSRSMTFAWQLDNLNFTLFWRSVMCPFWFVDIVGCEANCRFVVNCKWVNFDPGQSICEQSAFCYNIRCTVQKQHVCQHHRFLSVGEVQHWK